MIQEFGVLHHHLAYAKAYALSSVGSSSVTSVIVGVVLFGLTPGYVLFQLSKGMHTGAESLSGHRVR